MNAEWNEEIQNEEVETQEENTMEEIQSEAADTEAVFDDETTAQDDTVSADEYVEDPDDKEQLDEGMVINTLLGYLEEALQNPTKTSGFMGRPTVDVDKCLDIIDNIRQNMPVSLQYSVTTKSQRDRIIDRATEYAENKINKAKDEAKLTIEDADSQAADIINSANEEATQIISKAEADAADIVNKASRKAQLLVNNEEILKAAKREASELRATTARNAKETRRKALSDAWLVYQAVQKQMQAMEAKLDKFKNELSEPGEYDK